MSERISIAKLREQFTLWPQVLCVLDAVEAAHEWMVADDHCESARVETLAGALTPFDFEDA